MKARILVSHSQGKMLLLAFHKSCSCLSEVTEEDFLTLAESLRPWTEQAMKIEVAPWIKEYVTDMDNLYTELTVEHFQVNLPNTIHQTVKDYREIFEERGQSESSPSVQKNLYQARVTPSSGGSRISRTGAVPTPKGGSVQKKLCQPQVTRSSGGSRISRTGTVPTPKGGRKPTIPKNYTKIKKNEPIRKEVRPRTTLLNPYQFPFPQKVFAKGDPGIGKTTLAKKIAWDWAKRSFTRFSLVFLVFLKLVNPGDAIENVIIQQMPPLEGMGISPCKILQILNKFGPRCLLILDGLDEHASGQNLDVMKIIEGKKLLYCNTFLTSRPHSVSGIKKYFNSRVRINGFTRKQAELFARKILDNEKQVQSVLNYNPAGYRQDISLYNCPILLSFMCLLVRYDDIDLASESINSGEIYVRMVRCLYKKFLIRQKQEFDDSDFVTVLGKIGKLALNTLRTGKPLLKRSEVIKQVGVDAFDYGLLIGHEDFRLISDETADIFVTFPHRSIQEFLGALYFILCLIEGVSVQSLLGDDPDNSLFLQNPLFFYFANWVIYGSEDYFPTIQQKRGKAAAALKLYILHHGSGSAGSARCNRTFPISKHRQG